MTKVELILWNRNSEISCEKHVWELCCRSNLYRVPVQGRVMGGRCRPGAELSMYLGFSASA